MLFAQTFLTVTNHARLDRQVSPQVKPLLDSLRTLYQTCAGAPQMQAPNKKREMDDNSKKMGQLFWKVNAGYALQILTNCLGSLVLHAYPPLHHVIAFASFTLCLLSTVAMPGRLVGRITISAPGFASFYVFMQSMMHLVVSA